MDSNIRYGPFTASGDERPLKDKFASERTGMAVKMKALA